MRLLHPAPAHDLTYSDVFMVPGLSTVPSRLDVPLTTPDGVGTTLPIVVANMTAVAASVIGCVKRCHPIYETPITLTPGHTIGDALGLIHKRAHGTVVVTDDG